MAQRFPKGTELQKILLSRIKVLESLMCYDIELKSWKGEFNDEKNFETCKFSIFCANLALVLVYSKIKITLLEWE